MSASASPDFTTSTKNTVRLPELFGRETSLFGWQGITLSVPRSWNLASFGGDFGKGNARLTDDDGARLELIWESCKGTPDVARSVELLLKNIEREAKKQKHDFKAIENPKLFARARREHADKDQATTFGWSGDAGQIASHGWGAAWHCSESNRVIVTHFLGRGTESADKSRRMAVEVLGSCVCHAHGGWNTWSVYDLQFEVPEEFHLVAAKLQTGRLEFDFERIKVRDPLQMLSPSNWNKRVERIGVRRLSAANVILENESLKDWSGRVAVGMFKAYRLSTPVAAQVLGGEGIMLHGALRDLRREFRGKFFNLILRRKTTPPRATVWQDKDANKIFVLLADLQTENAHVQNDVLDSIAAH